MKARPSKKNIHPFDEISGAWCNTDASTSSIMESVSFVTPVLESFFIHTVNESINTLSGEHTPLLERGKSFIQEEANHSRIHGLFNEHLFAYLGKKPPGLQLTYWVLKQIRTKVSLHSRLLLAAALEHIAAVLSKVYLQEQSNMTMTSDYAQAMFLMHANEEIGHRSVVFDLWLNHGTSNILSRMLVIALILSGGALYLIGSFPWILYKKHIHHSKTHMITAILLSLGNIAFRMLQALFDRRTYCVIYELFSFIRPNYHPDHLIQ
ncbi:MAG: metal-dependent hydrolase [Zetaproteobacteria bacterium]|nr:metal-dependent hydrolase [Zetaproteobacteria bacterium]